MKSKFLLNKFLCFLTILVVVAFIISCGGSGLYPDVTFGGNVLLQDGTPLEGIEVTFFIPKQPNIDSDDSWTVLTDEKGEYSDWTYSHMGGSYITITPHHPDYIFSPDSYFLVKPFADNLDLNFTAIPTSVCNNDDTCNQGEDCLSCPNECAGVTTGKPSSRYCCGADTCEANLCGPDCNSPIPEGYCGDGIVDAGEDCDAGAENGSTTCGCQTDCTYTSTGTDCNDDLFCTAGESCDGTGSCGGGSSLTCDDGVGCTADSCDEANDTCINIPDNTSCDDGIFCNGAEFCDPVNDCTIGAEPCLSGENCNEISDSCEAASFCGDGIVDAGEQCDAGAENGSTTCGCQTDCTYTSTGTDCNDDLFCTAGESCDGTGYCGGASSLTCDDGVGCTADSCDEANDTCINIPDNTSCDDGIFCNGAEFCNPVNDCTIGAEPCLSGENCNEISDSCEAASFCGDGVVDPGEDCDAGAENGSTTCGCQTDCTYTSTGTDCNDDLFCTAGESCDGTGYCGGGSSLTCDDGVGCTADSCDEANDTCINIPDNTSCDDGIFCNGTEFCNPVNDCTIGAEPCLYGENCNEISDSCEAASFCGDGVVDPGEECDDGNTMPGDGCDANCMLETLANEAPNGVIDDPVTNVTITAGETVSFSGSGTDPDNNLPLSFTWNFGAGSGIANSSLEDPGPVRFNTPGVYAVTFNVTDNWGLADATPAFRIITVRDGSDPLIIPDWSNVSQSPFNVYDSQDIANPVLTAADVWDVEADFVADPFLYYDGGIWYLFMEVLRVPQKGLIGVANSLDGINWTYDRIVLEEPFHLSYPYVFSVDGIYYMVPETFLAESINIYQAEAFPYEWKHVATIASGRDFVDSSIMYHNGLWWMFTSVTDEDSRQLLLYYSADLLSGWEEHPLSPIDVNYGTRPGGRAFIYDNDRIIRLSQTGRIVRAFEVDTLTETDYAEHEIPESPILTGTGVGWNSVGMHHFDPWWTGDKWIAAVDGDSGDRNWSIGIYSAPQPGVISQANWQLLYTDSEELIGENGAAENAFDNNPSTIWHTEWLTSNPLPPHEIQIDLGANYDIDGFRYMPRQNGVNGRIGQYEFYISDSPSQWGSPVVSGSFPNTNAEQEIIFSRRSGRFIRLRALTEVNGNPWTSVAEINVIGASSTGF